MRLSIIYRKRMNPACYVRFFCYPNQTDQDSSIRTKDQFAYFLLSQGQTLRHSYPVATHTMQSPRSKIFFSNMLMLGYMACNSSCSDSSDIALLAIPHNIRVTIITALLCFEEYPPSIFDNLRPTKPANGM